LRTRHVAAKSEEKIVLYSLALHVLLIIVLFAFLVFVDKGETPPRALAWQTKYMARICLVKNFIDVTEFVDSVEKPSRH